MVKKLLRLWVRRKWISPDNKYIIVGSDGRIRLYTIETDRPDSLESPFGEYRGSANSVSFSPDGKYIAFGSVDRIYHNNLVDRTCHDIRATQPTFLHQYPIGSVVLGVTSQLIQIGVGCSTLPVNSCFGFVLNCIRDYIFRAFFMSLVWIVSKLSSVNLYMRLSGWDARRKCAKLALRVPRFSYCYIHRWSNIHNRPLYFFLHWCFPTMDCDRRVHLQIGC